MAHLTQDSTFTLGRRPAGLIYADNAKSFGGYTLFAPQTAEGRVYLVDEQGEVAHQWQLPVRAGRDAVLLPNGNLGYNGSHRTSANLYPAWDLWHGGDFYEVTPDNEIVWHYEDIYHHHDAQWLANGNLLYTAASQLPADIAARVTGGDPRRDAPDGVIQSDVVKEVNRDGEVVWEWRAWEHLNPEDFPIHDIFDRRHWPMINGLSVTRDGLVLMSLRTTSGVIAVDKESGKVIWHAGPEVVAQQHTPVEMENGSILVFDNGNLRPGAPRRIPRCWSSIRRPKRLPGSIAISSRRRFSRRIWGARSGWRTATPLSVNRRLAACLKSPRKAKRYGNISFRSLMNIRSTSVKALFLENRTAPSVRIAMPLMPLVG